jgi:hypothetical protein
MKINQIKIGILVLISGIASAQVGIGTPTPDSSALLDLTSNEQGFLVPRMTTAQRNLINPIATGLMIFNTETAAFNFFNGTAWKDMTPASVGSNAISFSADASNETATMSPTDVLIPGMSITPDPGKYTVSFNAQYNSAPYNYDVNITEQSKLDLSDMYAKLMAVPTTVLGHAPLFGNNEVLTAGVYYVEAATSLSGTLTLNAQGNPNAIFIFKLGAAFTSQASAKVILSNAASACNVFWISQAAISLAASTEMKGTLLSNTGAVNLAAGCTLEGRMFSKTGAITIDGSTVTIPSNCNYIDMGVLTTFALFTSDGGIANTGISNITGDLGTNDGIYTGCLPPPAVNNLSSINNQYLVSSPLVTIDKNVLSTFSIYQNGILIPSSIRTRRSKAPTIDVTLQAIATVALGQAIEVRWKTDVSQLTMTNRIITVVKTE